MASIEMLLKQEPATRHLRVYAYLTAARRTHPNTSNVVDCLVPFVKAGIAQQKKDEILNLEKLRAFLLNLGLDIPDLVLRNFRESLRRSGTLEWRQGEYYVVDDTKPDDIADVEGYSLDTAFIHIEEDLEKFASDIFTISKAPYSASWVDALISLLKSKYSPESASAVAESNNLITGDTKGAETLIVVRYIEECERDPEKAAIYHDLSQVFSGIMIEDFIGSVQKLGSPTHFKRLEVYYDTSVLLRLLGTSGKFYQLSTMDMHNTLLGLGCVPQYLEITHREVSRIIRGIVENPAGSHPETVQAYYDHELPEIDDFEDTFQTRLEDIGVNLRSTPRPVPAWEIDTSKLTQMLIAESDRYRQSTADKDARAVGTILQLRRGHVSTELDGCRHVFISSNPVLQRVSKKFAEGEIEEYDDSGAIPPILTVGQVATLSWLCTPKDTIDEVSSRELLANCYNAIRPSARWMNKLAGTLGEYAKKKPGIVRDIAESVIFYKTTREIIQNKSLNRPEFVDKLNLDEVFRQAREESIKRAEEEAAAKQKAEDELKEQLQAAHERAAEQASMIAELIKARQLDEAAWAEEERKRVEAETQREKEREETRQKELSDFRRRAESTEHLAQERRERRRDIVRIVVLLVVVAMMLAAIFMLHDNLFAAIPILAILAIATPMIIVVITEADKLQGRDLWASYALGVRGVLSVARIASHNPEQSPEAAQADASEAAEDADLTPGAARAPVAAPKAPARKRKPAAAKR